MGGGGDYVPIIKPMTWICVFIPHATEPLVLKGEQGAFHVCTDHKSNLMWAEKHCKSSLPRDRTPKLTGFPIRPMGHDLM